MRQVTQQDVDGIKRLYNELLETVRRNTEVSGRRATRSQVRFVAGIRDALKGGAE